MIIDSLSEFCDAVSLVRGTGSALIGSALDSGAVRDLGNGQPLFLVLTVDTEVDSAAEGATVAFELRSDSSAVIDTSSGTLHFSTGAIAEANLTQGATFVYALPVQGLAYEQYIGIVQVTAGEAVTAGKINAFLTMDQHGWKAYAEGQN